MNNKKSNIIKYWIILYWNISLHNIQGHRKLLRFCSKLNITIAGAAVKLFNYFIKYKCLLQVLSFADSRWSTGKLYSTLNFTRYADTPLNYWYIDTKKTKRIYRYTLGKNKDDDQPLTEYQTRLNQGYLCIWDWWSSKKPHSRGFYFDLV